MSFYGKVFYQLENAFAKILIKNNGKNTTTAPGDDISNSSIPAIGLNSEFTLDSGNKWIKLKKGSNNYECEFYHSVPEHDDLTKNGKFVSFTKSSATGKDPTELEPGDQIKIQNLDFDEAGHISKVENKYFKLPITELDANLTTIEDRLKTLEEHQPDQDDLISTNAENISTIDGKYDKDIQDLQKKDETFTTDISNINKKIGTISNMGLNDNANIVGAIGNLNNEKLPEQKKSVVDNMLALREEIQANTSSIQGANLALTGAIYNLCQELEKHDIIIKMEDIIPNN